MGVRRTAADRRRTSPRSGPPIKGLVVRVLGPMPTVVEHSMLDAGLSHAFTDVNQSVWVR